MYIRTTKSVVNFSMSLSSCIDWSNYFSPPPYYAGFWAWTNGTRRQYPMTSSAVWTSWTDVTHHWACSNRCTTNSLLVDTCSSLSCCHINRLWRVGHPKPYPLRSCTVRGGLLGGGGGAAVGEDSEATGVWVDGSEQTAISLWGRLESGLLLSWRCRLCVEEKMRCPETVFWPFILLHFLIQFIIIIILALIMIAI